MSFAPITFFQTTRKLILVALLFFSAAHLTAQQAIFGVTPAGGTDGVGTVFKMEIDGSGFETIHSFSSSTAGQAPTTVPLMQATNGKLYGMTTLGGVAGKGVLFEYDPVTNIYTRKVDFLGINGANPAFGLCEAPNGKLYGTTPQGGLNDQGVLFEYDPVTSTFTKKMDFGGTDGTSPAGMIVAPNGKLWGLTSYGGNYAGGAVFRYDPIHNVYSKKVDLEAFSTGSSPMGSLTLLPSGDFYGVTFFGGSNSHGTLFHYDSSSNLVSVKHNFSAATDGQPRHCTLVLADNGVLYGLASSGGANNVGTLFDYDPVNDIFQKMLDLTTLMGSDPEGSLVKASNGKLYGVNRTSLAGFGALFEYTTSTNKFVNLVAGDGLPTGVGGNWSTTLMQAQNGKLYGMNETGLANFGLIFEYDITSQKITQKVSFNVAPEGLGATSLTQALNEKLYGMTFYGGDYNGGVLFEVDMNANTVTKKVDFNQQDGGSNSLGKMILAQDGKLYGVHAYGPTNTYGLIFSYAPESNTYTKLLAMPSGSGEPLGGLVQAPSGKMYGVTQYSSPSGYGQLFEYDPAENKLTMLTYFNEHFGGAQPAGSLTVTGGKLFGICQAGVNNFGALFEYNIASKTLTKRADINGVSPIGSLTLATNGKLYGNLQSDGVNWGSIFEYDTTTMEYSKKFDIPKLPNSIGTPSGYMMQVPNGNLYGLATNGGSSGIGTLFEYDINANTCTKKMDFTGYNGAMRLTSVYGPPIFVSLQDQTIAFDPLPAKAFGDPSFNLNATASSGLNVTFTSSDPKVASITGNTVTIVSPGTVQISAAQNGSLKFHAAQTVQQTLVVNKAKQTITFNPLPEVKLTDKSLLLNAVSDSGLPISYTSEDALIATISDGMATFIKAGTTTITASQPGDNHYEAAASVSRSLVIDLVTGIENLIESITPYPNPADTEVMVDLSSTSVRDPNNIQLYSITGQQLKIPVTESGGTGIFRCTVKELTNGLYFLKIPGTGSAKKIIVIH